MDYRFEIRNISDERAYHNTAILIYLKAASEILGSDINISIGNSLNQGYFTYPTAGGPEVTTSEIHKIRDRMERIISQDIEIITEHDTVRHAAGKWRALGLHEKAGLLEPRDPDETVEVLNLGGYRNCLYTKVLPSSAYVDRFDLRPYRNGMLLRLPNALSAEIPKYRDDNKLYDAYAESKRMRKYSGIDYLADVNGKVLAGKAGELIASSEKLHSKQLREFAERIVEEGKRIVLIAGPSSSGKTTTAKRLCAAIAERTEEPLYLGTDDYFVERDQSPIGPDGQPDFEGLDCLDLELFNRQMEDLLAGKEVDIPTFDFIKGTKVFGDRVTRLKEGQIIVIEGIHSLNDVLTSHIPASDKFKIYISPLTQFGMDRHNRLSTTDARLLRRMVRDNQFRNYDAEKTIAMWPKVRAGERVNIFPYSSSADVVFNSSTVYETNLLKTYAEPLLLAIPETSPQYTEAQRILGLLKYFVKIESADDVPDYSLIREFIGPRE